MVCQRSWRDQPFQSQLDQEIYFNNFVQLNLCQFQNEIEIGPHPLLPPLALPLCPTQRETSPLHTVRLPSVFGIF
jgi:hypothetical protein